MQKIMNEGGLIPYQLTVQVLVNALIQNPSKVSQFAVLVQLDERKTIFFTDSNR